LPPFNEEKDDLDAYLSRFEHSCQAFNVQQEDWSTQLARLLQGQALGVYQRMSDTEVSNYQTLKDNLLQRFRLTEGGYRKRFKQSRIESGETPEQFFDRLRRYLQKWRQMAGFEATYEGLEDMILRDQFFITCVKSLDTFLKEKGKMSLKEMSQAAANFIDAHGDTAHKKHPVVHKRPNDRKESNVKQANFGLFGHCGYRNHKTEDCR